MRATRSPDAPAMTGVLVPAQSSGYIGNSGRGQYLWYPIDHPNPVPDSLGSGVKDVYARVLWREIESTQRGVYNWAPLDQYRTLAAARGGRFGFRIMPFHQGIAQSLPDDVIALASTRWIDIDGLSHALPDWNDQAYIDRWQEIMQAAAARYNDDPYCYSVDVGAYGNWGEGHNWPYEDQYPGPNGQTEATVATLQQYIRIAADAFTNTWVYYNPFQAKQDDTYSGRISAEVMQYALDYSDMIAPRTDAFGGGNVQWTTNDIMSTAQAAAAANSVPLNNQPFGRWRIAPVTAEWPGTISPGGNDGSFAEGVQQVGDWHISLVSNANYFDDDNGYTSYSPSEQAAFDSVMIQAGFTYRVTHATCSWTNSRLTAAVTWTNTGVSPTYDVWQVQYQLRDVNDTVIATIQSPLDLRNIRTSDDSLVDTVDIMAASPLTGTETLHTRVIDPSGTLEPMLLGFGTRASDGAHRIGQLSDNTPLPG